MSKKKENKFWLVDNFLEETPEIVGGLTYGTTDESNPAPDGAELFSDEDSMLEAVSKAENNQLEKASLAEDKFSDEAKQKSEKEDKPKTNTKRKNTTTKKNLK